MLRYTIQRNVFRSFHSKKSPPNLVKSFIKPFLKTTAASIVVGALAYDGYNEFEICGGLIRFGRSLKIAVAISADYKWNLRDLKEESEAYNEKIREINLRCANRLLEGCLANGGLYVKIGQGVSAMNHILPREYTDTLKRLEDKCLPRNNNEVKKVFLTEFGQSPEDMFAEFNYKPIAAASLAQVFKAKTKDGKDVAVKVQYIDLIKRFAGDFNTILILQDLIKLVHKQYNFAWIIRDLRKNLEQELDFVHEGHNAERCARDMKKFKYVHVPTVEWNLTSRRVLTAEWIDGYKISDVEQIEKDGFSFEEVDKRLFNAFSEQIFNTGFVHADPHPGNVFLRKKGKGKFEIVILDHGLYEQLPQSVRIPLCQFWEAIILKDKNKMDQHAKELNVEDSKKFAEILLQRPIDMRRPVISKAKLTDADLAYLQKMAKNHFDVVLETLKQMPRNMLFVIRNLNTIRAIARQHGDPIDRPTYMAQYAQRCIYTTGGFTPINDIKWIVRRIKFDYHLLKMRLQFWLIRTYLAFVLFVSRSNVDVNSLLDYPEIN